MVGCHYLCCSFVILQRAQLLENVKGNVTDDSEDKTTNGKVIKDEKKEMNENEKSAETEHPEAASPSSENEITGENRVSSDNTSAITLVPLDVHDHSPVIREIPLLNPQDVVVEDASLNPLIAGLQVSLSISDDTDYASDSSQSDTGVFPNIEANETLESSHQDMVEPSYDWESIISCEIVQVHTKIIPDSGPSSVVLLTTSDTIHATKFDHISYLQTNHYLPAINIPVHVDVDSLHQDSDPWSYQDTNALEDVQNEQEMTFPSITTSTCSLSSESQFDEASSSHSCSTQSVDTCSMCGYRHGSFSYAFESDPLGFCIDFARSEGLWWSDDNEGDDDDEEEEEVEENDDNCCYFEEGIDGENDSGEESDNISSDASSFCLPLNQGMTAAEIEQFFDEPDTSEIHNYPLYTTVITTENGTILETEV